MHTNDTDTERNSDRRIDRVRDGREGRIAYFDPEETAAFICFDVCAEVEVEP